MTKDLTYGNPFSLLLKFSIPLLLGNIFQQFYNLVDTIIVGKFIGIQALTSIGVTSSVSFLITGFCTSCCAGFAIPIAQRFGAKDYKHMRNYIMNAAYLSLIFAVVLAAVTALLCDNILTWIHTPAEIFDGAYTYLVVILLGIPFTFLYNMTAGILRAMGDSKSPFYFLVCSTILNIILDLIFILNFHLGVAGAAYATIISQAVSGLLCLFYMRRRFEILHCTKDEYIPDMSVIAKLAMSGVPMGLQSSITALGMVLIQGAVNDLGTVFVSANTAASKIKQFTICPYIAFDTAVATYCSQNLGAKKVDRIYKGIRSGFLLYMIYSAILALLLPLTGDKIALIFLDSSETEVLNYVKQFFIYCGGFYLFLPVLNCFRSAIQGLGYSIVSMLSGLTEMLTRVVLSFWIIPATGFIGVCLTDPISWITAGICVSSLYPILMKRIKKMLL